MVGDALTLGAKVEKTQNAKGRSKGCLVAVVAIMSLGIALSQRNPGDKPQQNDEVQKAMAAITTRDGVTLTNAKIAIKSAMKDPESAKFGESFAWLRRGERVACGSINALNSFGAMAGATRWIVRVDKGVVLLKEPGNGTTFAPMWNRYCVGAPDDLKAEPTEFLGVKLGSTIPAGLQPYDDSRRVWVLKDNKPREFFGTAIFESMFMTDNGRVFGGQAAAKGRPAYDDLRRAMFKKYGAPTFDDVDDTPIVKWDWGAGRALAQLSFNPKRRDILIMITQQK